MITSTSIIWYNRHKVIIIERCQKIWNCLLFSIPSYSTYKIISKAAVPPLKLRELASAFSWQQIQWQHSLWRSHITNLSFIKGGIAVFPAVLKLELKIELLHHFGYMFCSISEKNLIFQQKHWFYDICGENSVNSFQCLLDIGSPIEFVSSCI